MMNVNMDCCHVVKNSEEVSLKSILMQKRVFLDDLSDYCKKYKPNNLGEDAIKFIANFYSSTSLFSIQGREKSELFAIALSHWRFSKTLKEDFKIDSFVPAIDKNGWSSYNTFIQIVIKDIPFVVESIKMLLNKNNIKIYTVVNMSGINVSRNKSGTVKKLIDNIDGKKEAFILFEIQRQQPEEQALLLQKINTTLNDILVHILVDILLTF